MNEWKEIEGFGGRYFVSRNGDLKSLYANNEKLLGFIVTKGGYKKVSLSIDGKQNSFSLHRLVAEAFIENPLGKPEVNHLDGNKLNNNVENLEWATARENSRHSWINGLSVSKKGESHYNSKLTSKDVCDIRRFYRNGLTTGTELARLFGVTKQSVSYIVNYKGWQHILFQHKQ